MGMSVTAPAEHLDIGVAGGSLWVGRRGGVGPTVLALHGVTATQLAWLKVAGRVRGVDLLTPDLRGRGRSAQLPGPYGLATHVADLVAVLDSVGAARVVVAGHSMGGFVAVALAAQHPDRVSRLVLVDGGLPLGKPGDPMPPGGADIGPAAARLAMTFPTRDAYREFWRAHPALGQIWGPEVEAYVDYDLTGEPPELRSSCSPEAMRVDGSEVADHSSTTAAVLRVRAPIAFLRAERGFLDAPPPLYPVELVAPWLQSNPSIKAATVPDTNHYSILMGASGASAVAHAIADAVAEAG
jgi:lipase